MPLMPGWRAATSMKSRRMSSGHSLSINWSIALDEARNAPYASHKAITIPKIGSALRHPRYWSSTSAMMTEPLSSTSDW